jgi:hypothetical protein
MCDYDLGEVCDSIGMHFPMAAAGFYADLYVSSTTGMNMTKIVECLPWQACLGTCSDEARDQLVDDYDASLTQETRESCVGSVGSDACTPGYEGIRCSLCIQYNSDAEDCTEDEDEVLRPNGYYRMNQRCEPCPCTVFSFKVMVILAVLVLFLVYYSLDQLSAVLSEHASVMVGPAIILLTFAQTVSLSLDIDIPWPPLLRQTIQILDKFNVDLEVGRPECTISYGPVEKSLLVALTPVVVFATLGSYVVFKYISIYCVGRSRNQTVTLHGKVHDAGELHRIATNFLVRKSVTIGGTFFTAFSITFVRNSLRPFHCLANSNDASKTFMSTAPDIECSIGPDAEYADDRYAQIMYIAECSLMGYFFAWGLITGSLVSAGVSDNPGLGMLGFMGDKYEKRYFYWEMVIVARKLGLMTAFLLNTFEFAWLLGSAVLIIAVVLQGATRPYEDKFTDWAEFLTLVANLLILQTGPLFKLLAAGDAEITDSTGTMRTSVEATAVALMFGAVAYTAAAERHVWYATKSSVDYKEEMVEMRLEEARANLEFLKRRKRELLETHYLLRQEEIIGTAASSSDLAKAGGDANPVDKDKAKDAFDTKDAGDSQGDRPRPDGDSEKIYEGCHVQLHPGLHSLPLRRFSDNVSETVFTWMEEMEDAPLARVLLLRELGGKKNKREWARLQIDDAGGETHVGWTETTHKRTNRKFLQVVELNEDGKIKNENGTDRLDLAKAHITSGHTSDLSQTIHVGGISDELEDEANLVALYSRYGTVTRTTLRIRHEETTSLFSSDKKLSWALISFTAEEDAQKAISGTKELAKTEKKYKGLVANPIDQQKVLNSDGSMADGSNTMTVDGSFFDSEPADGRTTFSNPMAEGGGSAADEGTDPTAIAVDPTATEAATSGATMME